MSDDQPKISEPKTVEIGGVRYKVAASYPEPTGTLEDAARIVAERYGLARPIEFRPSAGPGLHQADDL